MIPSHPVRLGVVLNFSVFQYEHNHERNNTMKTVQKAIESAMKKMDNLKDDQDREDTRTIIDLMRENLNKWEDEKEGAFGTDPLKSP